MSKIEQLTEELGQSLQGIMYPLSVEELKLKILGYFKGIDTSKRFDLD